MDLVRFRTMVENGSDFFSAPKYEDHYPYLSLDECAHEFTMSCINDNIALYESIGAQHDKEINAAIGFITEGAVIDYDAINEEAKEGILAKIEKLFTRIKNFVSSLINKIKVYFDRAFADGSTLVKKYSNSDAFKNTEALNALKFKGPDLSREEPFKLNLSKLVQVSDLITHPAPETMVNKNAEEISGAINKIDDEKSSTRVANMVELISGEKVDASTYKKDLANKIIGDPVEMSYGKGMFNKATVEKILTSGEGFKQVIEDYKKLYNRLDKEKEVIKKAAKSIKAEAMPSGDKKEDKAAASNLNKYIDKYLTLFNEAMSVVSTLQNIRTAYHKLRMSQAKKMYAMMLTAKTPKAAKESFDLNDLDFSYEF